MGWGENHNAGAGTTGQIEDAHRALDVVQVRSGPLAIRALEAAGIIDRLRVEGLGDRSVNGRVGAVGGGRVMGWPLAQYTQHYMHTETMSGDCLRAAVASLLGMDITDVPHFVSFSDGADDEDPRRHAWWWSMVGWAVLLEPSFDVVQVDPTTWPDPDDEDDPLGGCYLLTGPSPRGDWNHTVVARAGEIVWDPHPSRDGLAGKPVAAEVWVRREVQPPTESDVVVQRSEVSA